MIELEQPGFEYQSKHSNSQFLSASGEKQLSEYVIVASNLHFGLSVRSFRPLAYNFAVSLNLTREISYPTTSSTPAASSTLAISLSRTPDTSISIQNTSSLSLFVHQ